MNEHYKMINDRFDIRAGKLLSNGWEYRGGKIVDEKTEMRKANQAYFFDTKNGRIVNSSIVLYSDDLVFCDMTN